MCNLYRMTSNVEAMRRLFSTVDAPNLPLSNEIYPKREAPIIKADPAFGKRRIEIASWGIIGPAAAKGPSPTSATWRHRSDGQHWLGQIAAAWCQ